MFSVLRPVVLALVASLGAAVARGQDAGAGAPAATPPITPAQDVVQPPAKENFRVYLLMGQSNMAGRGRIAVPASKPNPRILSLSSDGQWVMAKDPLHEKDGRVEPGVGPGISFATDMLAADPAITIGLVPCAVGGTPLKRWVKGGDLYVRAMARARIAAQAGAIGGVLWHQGESDSDKQPWADTYGARLSGMIADLRNDLGHPHLPVVVGQIGEFVDPGKHPYANVVREAIKSVAATVPHVGLADSAGLKDKGDNLHFDTDAQQELGVRYARAMREAGK